MTYTPKGYGTYHRYVCKSDSLSSCSSKTFQIISSIKSALKNRQKFLLKFSRVHVLFLIFSHSRFPRFKSGDFQTFLSFFTVLYVSSLQLQPKTYFMNSWKTLNEILLYCKKVSYFHDISFYKHYTVDPWSNCNWIIQKNADLKILFHLFKIALF